MMPPSRMLRCVRYADAALVIAHYRNARLFLVRGQLVPDHGPALALEAEPLMARYPQGMVGLSVVLPNVPTPSRAFSKEVGAMVGRPQIKLIHVAMVIQGRSLWARSMRTVARGIMLLGRAQPILGLYEDEGEAARSCLRHIAGEPGAPPLEAEILMLLDLMRALPTENWARHLLSEGAS